MSLDLASPFYTYLANVSAITSLLGTYLSNPSIHTRRPIPVAAQYPMIVVSPAIAITDEDGLVSRRPVVITDIAAYGQQDSDYRTIDSLGYLLRSNFHRQSKFSISVSGYDIIDLVASGPVPAPTDDNEQIGRMITVTTRLVAT